MFPIQHGETIIPLSKILDYPKEFIPIMTLKPEASISMEWLRLSLTLPQDQLFFFTLVLTTQLVLTQISINGDKLPPF